MKKIIIILVVSILFNSCTSGDSGLSGDFLLGVRITRDGAFSLDSKYKIIFEELDDLGIKITYTNEIIGESILFYILPYGSDSKKNRELIEKHTRRKFKFTLYEDEKAILSKVITVAAGKHSNRIKELKVDNMDYVKKPLPKLGSGSIKINLPKKKM